LENQTLKDKVKRLSENMKSLKYKDLMESKLNVTTENFNKEIQNLEQTLQRYMDDNKRLTMEVSRRHDMTRNFDNSMIQATVDNEKRLLKAQNKYTQLMKELVEAKKKISDMEREKINDGHGVPFNLDESQIPFNPNQSQMKFGSGVKKR
jgi:DNA repair exonuclease SbcCD ATPase subunit